MEAAAACLDYGLQTTPQGFILKPVGWSLIVKAVQSRLSSQGCPAVADVLDKFCGSVCQKYFSLLGTSPSGLPELVAAKLDSLITSPHRPAVAQLLAGMHTTVSMTQRDQSSITSQHPRNASVTVRAHASHQCCTTGMLLMVI